MFNVSIVYLADLRIEDWFLLTGPELAEFF